MARVKGGLGAKKRHNRTLKLAKGYRGARSKQYRVAKQSVMRALTSSYAGRKERKRQSIPKFSVFNNALFTAYRGKGFDKDYVDPMIWGRWDW